MQCMELCECLQVCEDCVILTEQFFQLVLGLPNHFNMLTFFFRQETWCCLLCLINYIVHTAACNIGNTFSSPSPCTNFWKLRNDKIIQVQQQMRLLIPVNLQQIIHSSLLPCTQSLVHLSSRVHITMVFINVKLKQKKIQQNWDLFFITSAGLGFYRRL